MDKGVKSSGGLHVGSKAGGGRAACCVGKALRGLQKLGSLASMLGPICACARCLSDSLGPASRYDLMPQAGKKLSIPFSSPFTQAVQSNMVYPPREVSMVSTNITARRINADR